MLGAFGGDILRGSESGGQKLRKLGLLGMGSIVVGLL
jgi:hypothetical protein